MEPRNTNQDARKRRSEPEQVNRAIANMVLHGKPATQRNVVKVKRERSPSVVPSAIPSTSTEAAPKETPPAEIAKDVAFSLVDLSFVLGLVFGGCCSNVWAYEYLLKIDSKMGTTLTFSQMLFVTLHSLPSFLTWDRTHGIPIPRLKDRKVPLSQWILQVLVHTSGSLLNNWAFAFDVPLTVQIVFRSAGLVVSILLGFLFMNKRYTFSQLIAILIVSTGVIFATLSRPSATSANSKRTFKNEDDFIDYSAGVLMLTISLFTSGILGLLQEKTYTKYGPHWKEGVFYTHFLSLPVFFFLGPHVKYGFRSLHAATMKQQSLATSTGLLGYTSVYFPYISLAANLITQLICVTGVNQLTSRVSSVSTNLVLTTRKALSLCFSVWWFGNGWNAELGLGACMVFLGSLFYTYVSSTPGGGEKKIEKVPNNANDGKVVTTVEDEQADENGDVQEGRKER